LFKFIITYLLIFLTLLNSDNRKEVILYCGITMIKPLYEMKDLFENRYKDVKITIIQGGSKDLYDSLKMSEIGDLYLPGSHSYIINSLKDRLFTDMRYIGINRASLFVQKGNPKNIESLKDLIRDDLATVLCNPKSGSIGKETKNILLNSGGKDFCELAYDNAVRIEPDSRSINQLLRKDNRIDASINWRATSFWEKNRDKIDIVEIDKKFAKDKFLILTTLRFSKNRKIAEKFLLFSASEEGLLIMKKYGF